ncbi:MAG TPA: 5'/3'-nucleotidase SurE, partial [Syntrophales bacterium]|nr:5'/3'-nucleotidase SurE [Syntrophales bacterium]
LGTHSRDADFGFAARFARKVARFMLEHNPNRHIPLNVNVPALPEKDIRGVVVTRQGQARLMEQFEKRIDPRENVYYWLAGETQVTDAEDDGTDFLALRNGMISITPIYYDLTRHDALEGLRAAIDKLAP